MHSVCQGVRRYDPIDFLDVCGIGVWNEERTSEYVDAVWFGASGNNSQSANAPEPTSWEMNLCTEFGWTIGAARLCFCWQPVCLDAKLPSLGTCKVRCNSKCSPQKHVRSALRRWKPYLNDCQQQNQYPQFLCVTVQGTQASRLPIWRLLCYIAEMVLNFNPRVLQSLRSAGRTTGCRKAVNFERANSYTSAAWIQSLKIRTITCQIWAHCDLDAWFTANRCGEGMAELLAVRLPS